MFILQGSVLALSLFTVAMAKPADVNTEAMRAVFDGTAQFSSNFYQAVAEEKTGNLVTSPLSAALVLSMAAYGAGGNTYEQFKNVLHLPQEQSLGKSGFQGIIDSLNNVKNVDLKVANKAFIDKQFSVKPTYKELTETYFRSPSESIDFGQSAEAAATINDWVKNNTNNRIKELFQAGDLSPMTSLVLANAVYFKGQWKNKFDPELTEDMPFNVNKDTVKNVPTMYIQKKFRYGEISRLNAKFIELPYKGDQLSMVVILPDQVDGLAQLEENLRNENLGEILGGYKAEVGVSLPKFKIETTADLNGALAKLGMTDMFENSADFSGISDQPLKVSKVTQKAFIEVNEEGSEAAAATGIAIVAFSLPIIQEFKCDHPFYYAIVKTSETDKEGTRDVIPIFTGRVVEP